MTLLSDHIYILFLGRVLGGISGTLLWSVFESWLVAEYNKLSLENAEAELSSIFSMMTTSNTCVAIFAGLLAGWLVDMAKTAQAPFMVSIVCLMLAFVAISKYWVSSYCFCVSTCADDIRVRTLAPAIVILLRVRLHYSSKKRLSRHAYQLQP